MSSSSSNTPAFIATSERFYLYVRQFAIKSIYDASVELITNIDDAYSRMNSALVTSGSPVVSVKNTIINYNRGTNTISFTDNATGVSGTDMPNMFLQIGNYSSTENTRGFFSRGAKDVSILGDVTFESIKDGLYSKCTLGNNAYGSMIVTDVAVTDDQRASLNVPVNGTVVSIVLASQYAITDAVVYADNLSKTATLRNIMTDVTNSIVFNYYDSSNALTNNIRLSYTYPSSTPVLNIIYTVPGYPDATATFIINKADTQIVQPNDESRMEFGFLLGSMNAIYEVNTIQSRFRYSPYISYVFGSLQCDYIAWLMYDIDQNGPSTANPMIIIDPSRSSGLNLAHPFTQALMGIAAKRLDLVLQELDSAISNNGIIVNNFADIIQGLQSFGAQFLPSSVKNSAFTPDYKSNLILAIQNDREKYVQVEQNFMLNTFDTSTISKEDFDTVSAQTESSGNWIYILTPDNTVVKVPTNGIDPLTNNLSENDMNSLANSIRQNINNTDFSQNPFIYAQDPTGELVKLFIYMNGSLGDYTGAEKLISPSPQSNIDIVFTNDINVKYQYNISYPSGAILVKININDPLVNRYIATNVVSGESTSLDSTGTVSQNNGYIFLSGMFTEIFARVMVNCAIQNTNLPNISAATDYYVMQNEYQTMANLVKIPIDNLFSSYYKTGVANSIDAIATAQSLDATLIAMLKSALGASAMVPIAATE